MKNIDPQKIEEVLNRGVEEVIDKENLKKKLLSGKMNFEYYFEKNVIKLAQ